MPGSFRYCLITFVLLISVSFLKAQQTLSPKPIAYPEFRFAYGFVIRHHIDMGPYTQTHFPAFEISSVFPLLGAKRWHQEFHYPEAGISYWYSNLGNSPVLGDVHSLFTWLRLPFIEKQKLQWNYRIGVGLGYFREKFDIQTNYKNLAIGSNVNAAIQLLTELRWQFCSQFTLSGGLGWAHFSNGTMISPNYGINMPNINTALSFHPKGLKEKRIITKYQESAPYNFIELNISHGLKEIRPLLGPQYNVFSGSVIYFHRLNIRKSIGGAFDLYYDESEKPLLERTGTPVKQNIELLKPGISGNFQADFGNLSVLLSLGTYLYQKEKSDGVLYDKLGLRYSFIDKYFLQLYLKTHYARADYIGWGIGMKINTTKN